ncbi:MAG: hypothetical protein P9M07_07650 [Candidatus Aceula meridiana]|nr:hypothetical protein [Candidatus Aceula meridiana]
MSQGADRNMSVFEKYLTLWVLLCTGAGIMLGKVAIIDVFTLANDQSDAYDCIEKLRDPSHVHTLTLDELQSIATQAGLANLEVKFYKVEIALEEQLKASFPKEKDDFEKIRQAAIDDIGKDRLGWGLHLKGRDIYTSLPIAVIVGEKV